MLTCFWGQGAGQGQVNVTSGVFPNMHVAAAVDREEMTQDYTSTVCCAS